ncbi:MAG: hypothetical protein MMC33_006401 [Icmadophila ericetorum]|nr:hypothetical protein [Icmadophila ericetorum]
MSYSQPRASQHQDSFPSPLHQHSSPPFDASTPPPPPPKPSSHEPSRNHTPQTGPPLPPPPSDNSTRQYQQQDQSFQDFTVVNGPLPPSTEEGWLPEILRDKSKTDLATLLQNPTLLTAILNSPSTTHPSLPPYRQTITTALSANISLSQTLLSLHTDLTHLRTQAQSSLLQLHALERQWRAKQVEIDDALEPFSPRALHQRLVTSIGEQEDVCRALEESFVEGEGLAGEREVGEFLKRFREGRKVVWLRRERKERWDEGRVGGWR